MKSLFPFPQNKRVMIVFLVISGLLALTAVMVGIDDNLPGILLALFAGITFVLAFAHQWRTVKKFILLILASILGLVLLTILNISIDSILQNPATPDSLMNMLQSPASNALTVIIAFLCLSAFLVGATGSVIMLIRRRRPPA